MKSSPQTPTPVVTRPDAGDDVVLVDDSGQPLGRAPRLRVHSTETPLHLAFSTYILNAHGEVLITRRGLNKKTWPGVWTNSCCGHPRPGEPLEDAARRRIHEELGLRVGPLTPLLPDFRYRAVDASGIVENEICPVFATYVVDSEPSPDPDEVAEWAWVPWSSLASAAQATPQVYSPWCALQIPLIGDRLSAMETGTDTGPDPTMAVTDVDALLRKTLGDLTAEWGELTEDMGVDVLELDLPAWLGRLLVGHGKRLRVTMAYWGFVASGGRPGTPGYEHLIRVAAALETLHLFALIHDDVMDESDSRRGAPSAHVQAGTWHANSGALGDKVTFGRNLAILLGDLAHALADRLVSDLPHGLRTLWYHLNVELIAGQRADLTAAAAGRRDRPHAERVARLKSGRYTIVRPLELGALAAGADDDTVRWLLEAGDHLGEAFALRDDFLGVWGDPELTGKPAGDDLAEAKATVLLDVARQRLGGEWTAALDRLGTPLSTDAEVTNLATAMREAGVDDAVEQLISAAVDNAWRVLDRGTLPESTREGLAATARVIAWRQA